MPPMKSPNPHGSGDDVSLTHLAHRWQVRRREVRQLLQEGVLPFVDVRGQLRVPKDAIKRLERRPFHRRAMSK